MTNTAKVVYQTADAIHFLNEKCHAFHRDLKPDNILVGKEGFDRIRVSDYGQARIVSGDVEQTVAATMNVGTDGYNAPETISRSSNVGVYDKRIDVWSLGVMMYMCASGAPPFPLNDAAVARERTLKGQYNPMDGPDAKSAWSKVPKDCKDLIKKMIVVDPAQRITMEEILKDPWLLKTAGK